MNHTTNFLSTKQIALLKTIANSPKYAAQIQRLFEQASNGKIRLLPNSINPVLKELAEQNLLKAYWGESLDSVRQKYYEITPEGYYQLQKIERFFIEIST